MHYHCLLFCSGLNNYIVRRYAATSRGVYYVYPGTPSSSDFEPSRQEWFMKAEKFPTRVVTTLPRLDPGGGGYIVSLSEVRTRKHTIVKYWINNMGSKEQ